MLKIINGIVTQHMYPVMPSATVYIVIFLQPNIIWCERADGKFAVLHGILRISTNVGSPAFCFSERLQFCLDGRCCSNNI